MTKILYGGTAADFVVATVTVPASAGGTVDVLKLNAGASLEAWDAGASGSQVTDLALFDGSYTVPGGAAPSGIFPALSSSTILVWAEDTLDTLFVCGQGVGVTSGQRWVMRPINDLARLRALEALDPIPSALIGATNGVAPLGPDDLVPDIYLPASVASGVIDITTPVGGTESGNVSLTAADLAAVPTTRTVSPGSGLTGGGDLTANRTLSVVFGTTAGTVAQGNDARFGTTGTSPRPLYAQVLSNDAEAGRKAAAASDPYVFVCDGTNDEVQIQAAIDAAAPLQSRNAGMPVGAGQLGKVELSGGRFNIGSAGIKLRTAVWLAGAGKGSEVRAVACNQAGMIALASPSDHLTELSDMWLQGNSTSGGTCDAVNYDMTGSGSTSAYPDSNPDSDHGIRRLYIDEFRGGTRNGIKLWATGTANNRGNNIEQIQIRDCTAGNGIWLTSASDSFISDCHVGGSGLNGYLIATGNTKISNCKSFYSNVNGFLFTSGRGVITGCESQDDDTGFNFDASPTTATGLIADTSNQAGIRVSTDRVQIVGFNIFNRGGGRYATSARGLWYDGAYTNCAILGNVENSAITTAISGTPATGFNQVTVS